MERGRPRWIPEEHGKECVRGESFFLNTFTAGSGGLDLNGAIISRRHQNPRDRIWVKHIYARWSVSGLIPNVAMISSSKELSPLFEREHVLPKGLLRRRTGQICTLRMVH